MSYNYHLIDYLREALNQEFKGKLLKINKRVIKASRVSFSTGHTSIGDYTFYITFISINENQDSCSLTVTGDFTQRRIEEEDLIEAISKCLREKVEVLNSPMSVVLYGEKEHQLPIIPMEKQW